MEFVKKRFQLYDDHQRGVPESCQVWSTINHVKGEVNKRLFNNRDITREAFLERCELIEFGYDDGEEEQEDYISKSESEEANARPVAEDSVQNGPENISENSSEIKAENSAERRNGEQVKGEDSNESSNTETASDQPTVSVATSKSSSMSRSSNDGRSNDYRPNGGHVNKRPAVEEEPQRTAKKTPEYIVIGDSSDDEEENDDVMFAILEANLRRTVKGVKCEQIQSPSKAANRRAVQNSPLFKKHRSSS